MELPIKISDYQIYIKIKLTILKINLILQPFYYAFEIPLYFKVSVLSVFFKVCREELEELSVLSLVLWVEALIYKMPLEKDMNWLVGFILISRYNKKIFTLPKEQDL